MGQTRVKKSKKAFKTPDTTIPSVLQVLESLDLDSDQTTTPTTSSSEPSKPASLTDVQPLSIPISNADELFIADPSYIEISSTEYKGMAVFAARKIPAGTLIISEPPLIRLTQAEEDAADKTSSGSTYDTVPLKTQFEALEKLTQKSYLALYDSQKSGFSHIKSIYYSNCYNLSGNNRPSRDSPGGSCIGLLASRINHACVPNVQFSFDESRGLMLFHAIKAIPRGREITSNYDSVFEVALQRKQRQMLYYGFRCNCEACDPGESEFWGKSDERRREMIEARREVRECERRFEGTGGERGEGNDTDRKTIVKGAVKALEKLELLLTKEGLLGLQLADTYRSLGKWSERTGDVKSVRRWKTKELSVCVTCMGGGSSRAMEIRAKIDQLGDVD